MQKNGTDRVAPESGSLTVSVPFVVKAFIRKADKDMEIWKDITGYEGLYQISSKGRVKSLGRYVANHSKLQYVPERIKNLSLKVNKSGSSGYLTTTLYKNNTGKSCYVHRLVAEAFIENPEKKATVNHVDGDKTNNCVENLEWNTYRENNLHAIVTGLNDSSHRRNNKGSIPIIQYDLDMNLINKFPSMREAERQTGVDCRSISLGIRKGWNFGGYIWKYA